MWIHSTIWAKHGKNDGQKSQYYGIKILQKIIFKWMGNKKKKLWEAINMVLFTLFMLFCQDILSYFLLFSSGEEQIKTKRKRLFEYFHWYLAILLGVLFWSSVCHVSTVFLDMCHREINICKIICLNIRCQITQWGTHPAAAYTVETTKEKKKHRYRFDNKYWHINQKNHKLDKTKKLGILEKV